MQWQHGAYTLFRNGSLLLDPIAVDGRQLVSDPCKLDNGMYSRYNQTELFKVLSAHNFHSCYIYIPLTTIQSYAVSTDPYHDVRRLDLKAFDGAPLQPMYIAYNPPEMLPSKTLNPLTTEAPKSKRQLSDGVSSPLSVQNLGLVNPDRWWWFGVFATSVGGLVMIYS